MAIASDGSIWTGTFDGGLYRWREGKIITRYEKRSSIFDILEDARRNVWASTRDGVIRWREADQKFERVSLLQRPPDTAWNVLALDRTGAIWAVTTDGFFCSKAGKIERVVTSGGAYGHVLSVQADGSSVLVGTSRGLFSVRDQQTPVTLDHLPGVPDPIVTILRDCHGNIWAGTWGQGLLRINSQGVERWSTRDGLADDFVRQLHEDDQGNLWIGLRNKGLPGYPLYLALDDGQGALWISFIGFLNRQERKTPTAASGFRRVKVLSVSTPEIFLLMFDLRLFELRS